jgi:hypothetical protein
MKTWTFIDKTQWPRGEWDTEPDKVQWTDQATGLACLAVRNRGNWCGYVAVPPGHGCFEKEYNDVEVEVHGGLTFSGLCQNHICHEPEPGQPDHVWWLGFDCAHWGDYSPDRPQDLFMDRLDVLGGLAQYRNLAYVQEECRSLAEQLARM